MSRRWVKLALVFTAVLVLLAGTLQLTVGLPQFGTETVDRSQPAVLKALRDLSQFHAAAGDYQVVLDIEQDVKWVPAALAGSRTLFVAAGSVNAYVDFGSLAEDGLVMSPDRKSVEVRLPPARLDKPNIDHERSYVFSQERGLVDRLNAVVETPDQGRFYVAAEERIARAATESGLTDRARDNTRSMLTGMLQALGFQVTIKTED
ncbi:DUF4230 domain-containing protein [Lentzea tibetensis]|uniref:DUF4230 domain-containing protein n=1 Tax=Lentzea tibetensis TaxID=2591470 RepID=A0A563ETL2_9PSEU|nr:DUF4230 domain-containing protein [Lentzea tibetensis]TWP51000.1 DUF4230 domain-containing protein [Lentzea tibetensis]